VSAIDREALDAAVRDGIVSSAQADALWARVAGAPGPAPAQPAVPAAREARAVGAVLLAGALGAAVLFELWQHHGAGAGLTLSVALGAALALAARARVSRGLPVAGSVAAALASVAAPIAVRAALQVAGVGETTETPIELDSLLTNPVFAPAAGWVLAAMVALLATGAPLLSAVLVAAVWTAAMAAAPLAFGAATSWTQRGLVSAAVGYLALSAGMVLDRRTQRDHAAWLYLAGLVAAWGGLASIRTCGSASLALGWLGNAALLLAAVALRRRVFAAFGAVGIAGAIGHAAAAALDPRAMPFVLAAIGAALLAGVVGYHRRARDWERALSAMLPEWGRRFLPPWPQG
jgi:hypothetical protein